MNSLLTVTTLSVLFAASSAFALDSSPMSCDAFIRDESSQVIGIFHDGTKDLEKKRADLGSLFARSVDTDWIGRYVVGRAYKTSTPDQQADYLKTYGRYVNYLYVSKFDDELAKDIKDIKVLSVSPGEPNHYTAVTKIVRGSGEDVNISFLLDDSNGKCAVHDMNVEGVSLLISERSEFTPIATSKGLPGVTAAMKLHLPVEVVSQP